MCLIEKYNIPKKLPKYGWKVFQVWENKYSSPFYAKDKIYPLDKWIKNKITNICQSDVTYLSGFHVFKSREQARAFVFEEGWKGTFRLRKVKMKKVTAYGEDMYGRVFVCQEMKIISKSRS